MTCCCLYSSYWTCPGLRLWHFVFVFPSFERWTRAPWPKFQALTKLVFFRKGSSGQRLFVKRIHRKRLCAHFQGRKGRVLMEKGKLSDQPGEDFFEGNIFGRQVWWMTSRRLNFVQLEEHSSGFSLKKDGSVKSGFRVNGSRKNHWYYEFF